MIGKVGIGLIVTVLIFGAMSCESALRERDIRDCRERGGQPITKSWWSGDYGKVGCIERATQP